MSLIYLYIEFFILALILSVDTLISGFAYGSNKIKIPLPSLLLINFTCSFFLAISLLIGNILKSFIPNHITIGICATILIVLGIIKIFDSFIKNLIKNHNGLNKNLKFSFFNLELTLNLYAEPAKADFDSSKELSLKEGWALAIALSLDSITIGFGKGLVLNNYLLIVMIFFFSFIIGIFALTLGRNIGDKVANKIKPNISWIGGAFLIILGLIKIFN